MEVFSTVALVSSTLPDFGLKAVEDDLLEPAVIKSYNLGVSLCWGSCGLMKQRSSVRPDHSQEVKSWVFGSLVRSEFMDLSATANARTVTSTSDESPSLLGSSVRLESSPWPPPTPNLRLFLRLFRFREPVSAGGVDCLALFIFIDKGGSHVVPGQLSDVLGLQCSGCGI